MDPGITCVPIAIHSIRSDATNGKASISGGCKAWISEIRSEYMTDPVLKIVIIKVRPRRRRNIFKHQHHEAKVIGIYNQTINNNQSTISISID